MAEPTLGHRLLEVVLYGAGIGITMRAFTIFWRELSNIEISAREGGAVTGAIIGLVVTAGMQKGHYVAIGIATILVVGYFIGKVIMKQIK